MEHCSPYALPPLTEDVEQQIECDHFVPLDIDETKSSSSRHSVVSVSSTGSNRIAGLVHKDMEAAAKLRQIREHKEKHRKGLREKLPPLDELRVKRYFD